MKTAPNSFNKVTILLAEFPMNSTYTTMLWCFTQVNLALFIYAAPSNVTSANRCGNAFPTHYGTTPLDLFLTKKLTFGIWTVAIQAHLSSY